MHHRAEVLVTLAVIIGVSAILALIMSGTFGSSLRFSSGNPLTGGAVTEVPCEGSDCPLDKIGCSDTVGHACRITCSIDEECDDRIFGTEDVCKNPGTVYSLCINRQKK